MSRWLFAVPAVLCVYLLAVARGAAPFEITIVDDASGQPIAHYAFMQIAQDDSEPVIVALNYRSSAETVDINTSGIAVSTFTDLTHQQSNVLSIALPAYGYAFLRVNA